MYVLKPRPIHNKTMIITTFILICIMPFMGLLWLLWIGFIPYLFYLLLRPYIIAKKIVLDEGKIHIFRSFLSEIIMDVQNIEIISDEQGFPSKIKDGNRTLNLEHISCAYEINKYIKEGKL